MADEFQKQSLLSGIVDSHQDAPKKNTWGKRFRHCRTAPARHVPSEPTNNGCSFSGPKPVFVQSRPSFKQVGLLLAIYLGLGAVCFFIVKDQLKGEKTNGILDALYFCIVTMTTVGYGDLVPDSVSSKLLACAFVFTGMAVVGFVLNKAADYLVEKQEVLVIKALHMRQNAHELEILKEVETSKARHKFIVTTILLLLLMVAGTIFLSMVEKLSTVDSFYCVCSTITTLGYGDKSFSTTAGRLFAVFWILTSTICLAQFFLYLAEMHTERKQQMLAKMVLKRRLTYVDLEAADLDFDGGVGAAEFIIYKLKEMGKVSPEDIAPLLDEFENQDIDHSGTLSTTDLVLGQSTH